jgi:imidazolonepropionase-like amidohydrolase
MDASVADEEPVTGCDCAVRETGVRSGRNTTTMDRLRWSLVAALVIVSVSCATAPPSQDRAADGSVVAFVHASVVPMDRERVLRDQTVVFDRGTIVAIGPASDVAIPRGAVRIDARGRYLIPALSDMHVHVEGESWFALLTPEQKEASKDLPFEDFLFPYVANGVTTVQVMSGTPELLALRPRIDRGEVIAPRMILARMIDAPGKAWPPPLSTWVASADEARAAVRSAKSVGYDMMKVYSFITRDSYDAVMASAKDLDMDVVGHIPNALSVEYVVDAGQKLIAHSEEVAKHAHGDYSAERIDYFARRIADGKVWMTPTLITTRGILEVLHDPDSHSHATGSEYVGHPMQVGIRTFITDRLYRPTPPEARKRIHEDFEKFQKPLTKVFHERGGQLMTGTDSLFPRLVGGFAVHGELRELVAVGLSPYEALRASTTIPYEFLGESSTGGTIELGKRPDVVMVDGNPLEDINAASKISGVMMRGRWLSKEEIAKKMSAIAAR